MVKCKVSYRICCSTYYVASFHIRARSVFFLDQKSMTTKCNGFVMDWKILCLLMIHVQGTTLQETRNHIPPNDKKKHGKSSTQTCLSKGGGYGTIPSGGWGVSRHHQQEIPPPTWTEKNSYVQFGSEKNTHTFFRKLFWYAKLICMEW